MKEFNTNLLIITAVIILCGIPYISHSQKTIDYPSWSPNGEKIAFHMSNGKHQNIFTVNIDGSNLKKITSTKAIDAAPFWSPDGKKIGFHSSKDGNYNLYYIDLTTMKVKQLTFTSAQEYFPASWSPDGMQIAYMSDEDGDFDIYIINVKSLKKKKLTDNDILDGVPSWSSSGDKILFHSVKHGGPNFQIYQMNIDGTNVRRITNNKMQCIMGAYNPVKKDMIVYLQGNIKHKYDNWEIMLLNSNSNKLEYLTKNNRYDFRPSWSPKGDKIVYTSRIEDENHLFIMNVKTKAIYKVY